MQYLSNIGVVGKKSVTKCNIAVDGNLGFQDYSLLR